MNTRSTFVLFGQAGQNVAQGDGRFGRRLRKAFASHYITKEEASTMMMRFAFDESDNYEYNDEGTAVVNSYGTEIIKSGELSYEHDSRTWEMIALKDLSEEDARMAIDDRQIYEGYGLEEVYEMYPVLKPEESEDTSA
jgi:hypothetical protein